MIQISLQKPNLLTWTAYNVNKIEISKQGVVIIKMNLESYETYDIEYL